MRRAARGPIAMRAATLLPAVVIAVLLGGAGTAAAQGNAWHIPAGAEPGIATMRAPLDRIAPGTDVAIYSGNQFQGAGNPGNQLQTGSAVMYRRIGDASWSSAPMAFFAQSGNNKYFVATIPASAITSGAIVEYYLRIAYSDHPTTFVYGGDAGSTATIVEATAQSAPFAFGVQWPLTPAGMSAGYAAGRWVVRIYSETGHVEFAGTAAETIQLAPPSVNIAGNWLPIGGVIDQMPIVNGIALRQTLGRRTVVAHVTFPAEGVLRYEIVDWGGAPPSETRVVAGSDASEHFYGFGEKFNALDQAGKVVRVVTADIAGDKGDNSYKVAPWFISSRGYGLHIDSTAESVFDMRASAADRYTARLKFGKLAFHVVGGPTPRDVLSRYTALTGRPAKTPPWAFGPWISSDAWRNGGEVRYVVEKMIAERIPASVFVFDSPWEVAYNDFTWNTTQFAAGGTYDGTHYPGFASFDDMMAFMRTHGLKVVVWLTPFVNVSSYNENIPGQNTGKASTYDAAAAAGYFVRQSPNGSPLVVTWWKGQGSPIDFTNAAARTWFSKQLADLATRSGGVIGGFKTDDGEADYIPLTASYSDGRTGVEMKNGHCLEYQKTVWHVLGEDGMVFARCGFTGTQAYPGVWSGDNEPNFGTGNGLPSVVVAGLSAAMSGYAIWGSDIGGYLDQNPSSAPADLFMRWTQFGALTPLMQIHRQVATEQQYPWSYGQAALDNYRAYAKLHTSLFPYLYTHAQRATVDGIPLIRPLPLIDSQPESHAAAYQYLLGDDLMVAPIVEKETTSRDVYLPQGGPWFDYWTNELVGGGTIRWTGTPTQVPLFVRQGAIIPRISPDVQTLLPASYVGNAEIATLDDALSFLIYPGEGSRFTVHDGTEVSCAVQRSTETTNVGINSIARSLHFDIYASAHPVAVARDGTALPEVAPDALATIAEGWTYDGTFVRIKLVHGGGATELVLGPHSDVPFRDGNGCGCATRKPDGGAVLLMLVIACVLRRRRR